MSGKGVYLVGPHQTYTQVQQAIDALVADQGSETFASEQKIIIAEKGVYEPFRIEADALRPDSAARLVIESALGIQAVVSGRAAPSKAGVGCLVSNNVPYVTIQRLFFRDLLKGAVFGVNSHRGVVNQCTFLQCGNVGVWAYQAEECMVSNSVFVNNEHGAVCTKTRGFALVHNTFFNDTGFFQGQTWLVFADLQDDRGQGDEDTGRLTLVNNIFYAQGGGGLLIYEKDVTLVDSNYNDWWNPGGGPLVEVREGQADGTVSRDQVATLTNWRTRSGEDMNSLNEDPGFVKPAAGGKSASIDLKLLKVSSLIRKGKLLCGDPTNGLPDYVDDAYICKDFNGKTRTSLPTIGANEVTSTNSFYGHQVFTDPGPAEADVLICGDEFSVFDRAAGQYASAVPAWFPKVHVGYFYVRDAEYYLFSEKAAYKLRDLQRTHFPLSCQIRDRAGIKVEVSGIDVTSSATWKIEGYDFVLDHAGLSTTPSSDVVLTANQSLWNEEFERFDSVPVKHRWKVSEGVQEMVFPVNPTPGAPIVITDDTIGPQDTLDLGRQFKTIELVELDDTLLEVSGARNRWLNGDFYYRQTGIPIDHEISSPMTGEGPAGLRGTPLLLEAGNTGEWIAQRISIDPDAPYVLSAYMKPVSAQTGSPRISVEFFDHESNLISSHGPYSNPTTGPEWTRFGMGIRTNPDQTYGRPDLSTQLRTVHTGLPIPSNAESMVVRFHPDPSIDAYLACVQLEQGYEVTPFVRQPYFDDWTIEYEKGEGRFYTVDDLTLHPVRNGYSSGFMSITPVPAMQWDEEAGSSTTLTDDWVTGRLEVLPWAKTSGRRKLRQREHFAVSPEAPIDEVVLKEQAKDPAEIRIYPSVVVARQNSEGESISVEVLNENGNPYAFETALVRCYDRTGEFPGYLAQKEWGLYSNLGQTINARLTEAGMVALEWIPPEQEDIEYRGDKPVPATGQDFGYVDTYYEVYPANHGGAVVLDQLDNRIVGIGDIKTGSQFGMYQQGYTHFQLPDYPVPGSMKIATVRPDDSIARFEESFSSPPRNGQFLVDYVNGRVSIAGDWNGETEFVYRPRTIWRDPRYPRRLYLHRQVLDAVTGDMSIQYDAVVKLRVEVGGPVGQGSTAEKWIEVDAVAQHTYHEAL